MNLKTCCNPLTKMNRINQWNCCRHWIKEIKGYRATHFLVLRLNGRDSTFTRIVRLLRRSSARWSPSMFLNNGMCRMFWTSNLGLVRVKKQQTLKSNDKSHFSLLRLNLKKLKQVCLVNNHLRHTASHTFDRTESWFSESVIRAVVSHPEFPMFFEEIVSNPSPLVRRLARAILWLVQSIWYVLSFKEKTCHLSLPFKVVAVFIWVCRLKLFRGLMVSMHG